MKLNISSVAIATMIGLLAGEANAQQAWTPGYSPSCSDQGGCRYGNDSVELIPYDSSYEHGNRAVYSGNPYRDSVRAPYENGFDQYTGGCGFGSNCGRSSPSDADPYYDGASRFDMASRCPYEQRQLEQSNDDLRSRTDGYEGNPNFDTRPNYPAPNRGNLFSNQTVPADQRPELRSSPSFSPNDGLAGNEYRPQSNSMNVPPTSPQFMTPPPLPPRQSASVPRQNLSPLLPPTTSPELSADHAGHDHSGHNH